MERSITAIIIAKDEEPLIEDCIKSLTWASEILLVDTGSTDATISIAKRNGCRVYHDKTGKTFPEWRNNGLREAKGAWVLYVDADERVSPKLRDEILQTITSTNHSFAYAIPRLNNIFGRDFYHGGWYPDYVKRLFYKKEFKRWEGLLHEEPVFNGELLHLENSLTHLKHETIFEMVEKTDKWSAIEARLMFEAKHPPMNIPRFLTGMGREFWNRMILKRAFLDGPEGIIMTIYQVFSRFISYAKLWEMQINNSKQK